MFHFVVLGMGENFEGNTMHGEFHWKFPLEVIGRGGVRTALTVTRKTRSFTVRKRGHRCGNPASPLHKRW